MNTSVATRQENPVAKFSSFMDKFKPQMALALPKHLTADRMARLALTQFSSNPKLQECEPMTIAASIMTASTLGLEPGVNGQGFLVPYKDWKKKIVICQFVPGWKGLVDIVNRAGRATVWTGAVFAGDHFEYALGDRPFIVHKPGDEDDPNRMTHVYSVGRVNGSDWPVIEVWSMNKVWKHRDKYNKVGTSHYSFRDAEMYARKVPLLQVIKYMPSSVELTNALAANNAAELGRTVTVDVSAMGSFVTMNDDPDRDETTDEDGVIHQGQQGKETPAAKPALPDEDLAKKKTTLLKALQSGQSVNDVVAALETKNTLTPDQKMEIAGWVEAAKPTEGATQ
jgi:recombination protein RecT